MMSAEAERARDRRDRIFRAVLIAVLALLALAGLWAADRYHWEAPRVERRTLPKAIEGMDDSRIRELMQPDRVATADPELALGTLVGDTRFRLNYATGRAIVMRPLHGVEEWIVPESFVHNGQRFRVVALDSFALLNAPTVTTVSFPASLEFTNYAARFCSDRLTQLVHRQPDGSERLIRPPESFKLNEQEDPAPAP